MQAPVGTIDSEGFNRESKSPGVLIACVAVQPSSVGSSDWASPTTTVASWTPPEGEDVEGHLAALSQVRRAALVSVLSAALGVATPLALSLTGIVTLTIPSAGASLSNSANTFFFAGLIAVIGIAFAIVSFLFYRDGFVALRSLDERFKWSATYASLAILGLAFVLPGLVLVLAVLLPCITPTGAVAIACASLGALFTGLAILLIGLILLVIGYVGILVAIWRLGDCYGESLFNVGAVLTLFPFLSIIGEILVLVAASRAESKVRRSSVAARRGALPSP